MEGAIFTAKEIVNMSKNRKSNKTRKMKGGKTNKKYTMQQVLKHNKKEDGWLVINKKVYNVTTWIDKHPGGAVIENYLGRDATKAFQSVGHPEYVMKTILPKYYIGVLQDKTRKNNEI
jgi:cytochrome b involved in lipid metabolism